MTPELALGIYGAVVATSLALWNIYTWWWGQRLYLAGYTSPHMQFDDMRAGRHGIRPEHNNFIAVVVQNRGAVPTQVNMVRLMAYPSLWARWRRKQTYSILLERPMSEVFDCNMPFRLERAGEFKALCSQNASREELSRTHWLYLAVEHSMSLKPFLVRIKPISAMATELAPKAA